MLIIEHSTPCAAWDGTFRELQSILARWMAARVPQDATVKVHKGYEYSLQAVWYTRETEHPNETTT